MVMEAPPSPQSVGREFVRQYYTLLNKAPNHLHRFYNNQSSFVHGGLDPPNRETSPIIGQKQIHQKIQQLNFRDCHAKITQVDSQATLGNGVVVQVTGELSNAGQPMRRFTQTFVLAAQSPKKYYVHNDIFRYQDEIISDEECENEARSETEDDVSQECQVSGELQPNLLPPIMQYFNPATAPMQPNLAPVQHHVLAGQAIPTVNGAVHPEDVNVSLPAAMPHQGQALPISNMQATGLVQTPLGGPAVVEEVQAIVDVGVPLEEHNELIYNDNNIVDAEPEVQDFNVETSPSNEPKTYANLLKSGNAIPFSSPPMMASVPASLPPARSASPPAGPRGDQGFREQVGNRNSFNKGPRVNQPRIQKPDSGRGPSGRPSFNDDGEDRKRFQSNSFSDMNQLFLGNIPHTATEDELHEIFAEFGTIVDLRVHSKTAKGPIPIGRAPPNYGFITYESQNAVQNCLAAKPIYYPRNDKSGGTPLNVEEKKLKDRQFYGSRPNNDNRNRDNGPRRGGIGGMPPNRNSLTGNGGGSTGITPNRTNTYNRNSTGGPPTRGGANNYNRR